MRKAADEERLDLFSFARPQQPVVDENALQALANGAVNEQRRDRTVDSARRPAITYHHPP